MRVQLCGGEGEEEEGNPSAAWHQRPQQSPPRSRVGINAQGTAVPRAGQAAKRQPLLEWPF